MKTRLVQICFTAMMLIAPFVAQATTWLVGPTRTYKVPSAVMNLVADGDTVLVDSGLYVGDVATWSKDNLVLRCPDGMARLDAHGNIAGDKGIWLFYGKNAYVEGFEFFGAAIPFDDGNNGAGIRVQGDNFTCRRCSFHNNQEGILTGNDTANNHIVIESCSFDHNGVETNGGPGFQHNIYIGLCSTARIAFCYFHASIVGHEVKCRANRSYIYCNKIIDGPTCDGSRSIDIPQGGAAYVIGNIIEKGPQTANSMVVGYGEEGFLNPDTTFYFINNTIVTNRNPTTYFGITAGTPTIVVANNIIAGPGHPLPTDTGYHANVVETDTSFFHFKDVMNYDYHLTQSFAGLHDGVNLGTLNGVNLYPTSVYVDALDSESISWDGQVGALPLTTLDVGVAPVASSSFAYPNPFTTAFRVRIPATSDANQNVTVTWSNFNGDVVRTTRAQLQDGNLQIQRDGMPSGAYRYQVIGREGNVLATGVAVAE